LAVAAAIGLPPDFAASIGRVPRGAGVCGRALATGQSVLVRDVEADPSAAPHLPIYRAAGIRGAFSAPLRTYQGAALGTIVAYFHEPFGPHPRQVRLHEMYARQAADLIEHARLIGELRQADRRKEVFLATLAH